MRRFRFKTEEELKESREWAFSFGMPIGWGSDKDLLLNLGKEITDPYLITECILNNRIRVSDHSGMFTWYYVEIKEKEKMKRYRFKTKEEFGRDMLLGWVEQMLPNLGKELINITPDIVDAIAQGRDFKYGGEDKYKYTYRSTDVVEIKELQRIPKQNWKDISLNSSICGVEMQNGNKFYLLWNVDGFIPVNLKKHSSTSYSDTSDVENGLAGMDETNGNKKLYKFESMEQLIEWATT